MHLTNYQFYNNKNYLYSKPVKGLRGFWVGYGFSFQRQEVDDEFWDGSISYKYRIEDARLGRFFSVDPLTKKYPHNSAYAFSENRVIDALELEGLESVTLSLSFTFSSGSSAFIERGYIIDFSKPKIQIYSYQTIGKGVETNISIAIQGMVGYYPNASAQDLEGDGSVKSFSAGEGFFGSVSEASTSNGKKGIVGGFGFGEGVLPISGSQYKTFTTIAPENKAANDLINLISGIDKFTASIDNSLKICDEEIDHLNKGIALTSRSIEKINKELTNNNLTKNERSKLIEKNMTYLNARKDYFKRLDKNMGKRKQLIDQKNKLNQVKNEVTGS